MLPDDAMGGMLAARRDVARRVDNRRRRLPFLGARRSYSVILSHFRRASRRRVTVADRARTSEAIQGPSIARRVGQSLARSPQIGLVAVLLVLGIALTSAAGTHVDRLSGVTVNDFLNAHTLVQMATDASGFAIMGVGATIVIISGGIDLSVGAIYALAGVSMAMVLRAAGPMGDVPAVLLGLGTCLGVALLCGVANGLMVIGLGVHPFIITLGTMWILRGLAFVVSHAQSILVPGALTDVAKARLGFGAELSPVPLIATIVVAVIAWIYLSRTVMGRHVFAIGGNAE